MGLSASENLHNVAGIGGFALQRFVKQCVHRCPCQIGVAGFFAAAGGVGGIPAGYAAKAGGDGVCGGVDGG